MLKKSIAASIAIAAASLGAGEAPFYPPAPGHEGLPVVFWSHYMPQVGTAQLDANGHADGGTDCFPFVTCGKDANEQHIRYALDAGINGFQMLIFQDPAMFEAARKVYAKTGKMFYVNPQWCDQGPDFEKAVAQMGKFAVEHKDDPHVFRIDGKQVHFFYGKMAWAEESEQGQLGKIQSAGAITSSSKVEQAKERIKAMGAEVLFMPALSPSEKIVLDRPELGYGKWPAFKTLEPGPFKWLAETKWDGIDSWGPGDTTQTMADMIVERLKKGPNKKFLYMPEIWPGYDSSNRAFQAIHCQSYGVKVLRDNLKMWVEMGFRQFDFVTWNDVNETMLLPSTRSPFGFSEIIAYYHQLAIDGKSPFDAPKAVVSYDPEAMYGDELFFQFVNIPEKDAYSSDYICQVRLENLDGSTAACLTARSTVPDERHDALAEVRFDTKTLAGKSEVLSPVVDVIRAGRLGNERLPVFQSLRLPPVTLRYNKVQFFSSYAIALDRVAPDLSIGLDAPEAKNSFLKARTGDLVQLAATVKGSEKLRRLTLAESRLSRGAFRADDTASALGEGKANAFLRIRCDRDFNYKLSLEDGKIIERYANHWDAPRTITKLNAPSCASNAFPHGRGQGKWGSMQDSLGKPVFRIVASQDSKIWLYAKGSDKPFVETSVKELAAGPKTFLAEPEGEKTVVRLELALDAVELNQDYPLPEGGSYVRSVPVDSYDDASRYFHAWALTASDKVAYSKPFEIVRDPKSSKGCVVKPDELVPCPFIHTLGVFDDFVDSSSSTSINPFTAKDIVAAELPARLVPYYLYDFEEGAGTMLNDGGTAHQTGRAWLSAEGWEWIKDGWRGNAFRLKGGTINLRAKSWPHGAYTFSARIRLDGGATAKADAPLAGDGDFWQGIAMQGLRIDILKDGRVQAKRQIRDCEGTATSSVPLEKGWRHLAVTHDLQSIKIFIDGKLAGEGPVSKPGYMRTHSTPSIGMSRVEKSMKGKDEPAALLTGDLDQIEIIGTALSPEAVGKLCDKGQWMAR